MTLMKWNGNKGILTLILVRIACIWPTFAQNLCPNGSFEEINNCPISHNFRPGETDIEHWHSPNQGTPDIFNACTMGKTGVPRNWAGNIYSIQGNGYVGMYMGSPGSNYREYLGTELITPLEAGVIYQIKLYFTAAQNSAFIIRPITIGFSKDMVKVDTDELIDVDTLLYLSDLSLKQGWVEAKYSYQAIGGESYFYIGGFLREEDCEYESINGNTKNPMIASSAYYFFDNVSIINPSWFPEKETLTPPEVERSDVVVYFNFDSFNIELEERARLKNLTDSIQRLSDFSMEIHAYTDSVGSESYNQKLSLRRAKSVQFLLHELGITAKIKLIAHGERHENSLLLDSLQRQVKLIILKQ